MSGFGGAVEAQIARLVCPLDLRVEAAPIDGHACREGGVDASFIGSAVADLGKSVYESAIAWCVVSVDIYSINFKRWLPIIFQCPLDKRFDVVPFLTDRYTSSSIVSK